MSQLQVVGSNI